MALLFILGAIKVIPGSVYDISLNIVSAHFGGEVGEVLLLVEVEYPPVEVENPLPCWVSGVRSLQYLEKKKFLRLTQEDE